MNRFKLVEICVCASTLALSGCAAITHNLTRHQVDQDLSSSTGNRGYILRLVPKPQESKILPQIIKKPAIVDEAEMDSVISVFSETIKKNPFDAGAYYNRAMAYFYKNNYERCWQDVHKAESLGYKFKVDFLEELKKVSGREE